MVKLVNSRPIVCRCDLSITKDLNIFLENTKTAINLIKNNLQINMKMVVISTTPTQ